MKKVFYFLCLVVFAFAACTKKTTPYVAPPTPPTPPSANSFSIKGDSFKTWSSVNIRTIPAGDSAVGVYDGSTNTTITATGIGSATDTFISANISIIFPGDNVTPAGGVPMTEITLSITKKDGNTIIYSSDTGTVGSVVVTSYGAIGKPITGTFNCTGLPNSAAISANAPRVNITNGKFSVTRAKY